MAVPLTILFVPIDAIGHINTCVGVGQELLKRGHKVAIAISSSWKGKLEPLGFIEKIHIESEAEVTGQEYQNEIVHKFEAAMALSSIEKYEKLYPELYIGLIKQFKEANPKLCQIIKELQPDVMLTDGAYMPAVSAQKEIPWITFMSLNPLGITVNDVPPAYSGYPTFPPNPELWNEFIDKGKVTLLPIFEDFKSWILENGGPELKYTGSPFWTEFSPYGNMYMFPEELSYTNIRPDPPNFFRFDTFMRFETGTFEIPEKLANLPGKLIYISMGTIGCSDLSLMRKLIQICSKAPHRFIFSKGPLGDQLDLEDNMWGTNYLPQTNILPLVDLVITHGGNNTVTETFYFGKKLLVLGLFCDQLDNAQRVAETGHGLALDPYKVTEEEFLVAIETLLGDDALEERMTTASKRMKGSKSQARAADFIEKIVWSEKQNR